MSKYDELVERLREEVEKWLLQPEQGGKTRYQLAEGVRAILSDKAMPTAITTLEAELEKLRPQVKVADDQWDAKCDELAAMKARGDRLAEALVMSIAGMMKASGRLEVIAVCNEDRRIVAALGGTCDFARQALTEWRDQ